MSSLSGRTAAVGFVVSGLALAAYPLLRPWGPETGAEGALTYASTAWPVAHLLGMVGFVTLALALRGLASTPVPTWPGRGVRSVETLAWLAAAFLLPYYGAEAFGLHALGTYAAERGDAAVLAVADSFRYGPVALTIFALGLLLLAVVGVRLAVGLWRSGTAGRLGGLLAAAGAVTYLPQFFGTPVVRVSHGLVLGVGLVLIGLVVARTAVAGEAASTEHGALVRTS
ncbi:hypothetical protein N865_06315 [Intrasporangium oryzae NRRL B-24470]|uniref:Uncharacterized protein n=1 Tax=Intrasporangium oryzae NRRL B-24470 TaxID=1386089 RepID=W9G844_9MICO|nr:hypothetical protein [Intrasporangium oryzae]EWT02381.1 hypothetical protein N865_06315 [Intrasporangium oryzae NRRL B-24470]